MERLRRKPYLFGIAAAAIVLGLAAMQFARPSRAENPRLEKYLPADAVGFIQVNDLRAQALKIIESEAWREFTKQNQAASSLFMMTANHAGALDASYAVALLGAGQDAEGRRHPDVVMIAEFNSWGARRTFENRVLRFVREAGEKGVTKKEEKYEKATINVLTREGRDGSFVYAQSGETLYLSNSAAAVKRALDVKAGKAQSLETNAAFAQALLAFVPEDAVAAFDASIAGAPNTFEEMFALFSRVAEQNGKKSPADALSEFASKTGVDLRADILASLGTEVCLAQLANEGGRGGVLILNLKDEAAFAGVLAKFAEHHKRAVSERDYKGVAVRSMAGEKGRGVEYAFLGGNLIASDEGALVERVIDTARGGRSLGAGEAYRAASANLTGQPQFVYYNSNADYLNRLGRTLKGGGQEFKSSGEGTASLRASFAYGLSRPEGFYVESRTPLGIFPRLLAGVSSRLAEKQEKGAE